MQPHELAGEALHLLQQQLRCSAPSIAASSIIMGAVQDVLLHGCLPEGAGSLQECLSCYRQRFQDLLVQPAAARAAKAQTPEAKVVGVAKALWTKLAKAPAHKQPPPHQQFLPSALRSSGKRQLDCLGIATAVLAVCQELGQQQEPVLASAQLMVSDDHCWIVLPAAPPAAGGKPSAADASCQPATLLHIEVTDARLVRPEEASGWLYAGGHGVACSMHQVVLMLVAAMSPDEAADGQQGKAKGASTAVACTPAAAKRMREAGQQLLSSLASEFPQALLYSTHMRWGLLLEAGEVEAIQWAHEAGDMELLARLGTDTDTPSAQQYRQAVAASSGWQWHPLACLLFSAYSRLQAAMCGAEEGAVPPHPAPAPVPAGEAGRTPPAAPHPENGRSWRDLPIGALLELGSRMAGAAAGAAGPAAQLLRRYAGRANRQRDELLVKALGDVLENVADAARVMLDVQQEAAGAAAAGAGAEMAAAGAAAAAATGTAAAAAAAIGAAAGGAAGASAGAEADPAAAGADGVQQPSSSLQQEAWLQPALVLLDAFCCFLGDSGVLPDPHLDHFLAAAACYSPEARSAALQAAAGQLRSERVAALAAAGWPDLGPEVRQALQMPGSRKRQRRQ